MPEEEKYQKLTEEEKERIIARHRELVDEMNKYLPDNLKLQYDADLEKKLDDQKFIGIYRIGQEMAEKKQQQRQIRERLESRFGPSTHNPDPLGRTIFFAFDTSGTDEAEAYNEKVYQDYLQNPDKLIFLRYGKLMNMNPQGIYDCNDDPLKLAEYYRDTYPTCDEAHAFTSVVNRSDMTQGMREALNSIAEPVEAIGHPVNLMKAATTIDFLACPKLTLEQSTIIQGTDRDLMDGISESLKAMLDEPLVAASLEGPHQYFDKFINNGIPLKEGVLVENRPISFNPGNNNINNNVQEVRYHQVFNGNGEGMRIVKREGINLAQVKAMNKSFQREQLKAWQKKFNEIRGNVGEFNVNQIEDQHKGGFFERNILHSTSQEYLDFMEAFKQYNDPDSPNYLNKENLKLKGQGYLQHKVAQGYNGVKDMKGTSLIRTQLVIDTIKACDTAPSFEEIKGEWLKDYISGPQKEPAVSEEQVAEKPANNVVSETNEMDNSLELEDDLNQTL